MNLLEQSMAWIIPAAAIAVFMVFAMMRFTLALLVRPPRAAALRIPEAELRERLAGLGADDGSWRVVEEADGRLALAWDVVDASWAELFARVKLTVTYRARMLLDEARGELRWFESVRSSSVFLGFEGWRPRWNATFFYRSGYVDVVWSGLAYGILPGFPPRIGRVHAFHLDTVAVKNRVRAVVDAAGWGFRPTTTALEVSPRWTGFWRRTWELLVPASMRGWSERRVWGILYPLSFALFFVYVVFFALSPAELDAGDAAIMALVTGIWWAVWALLAWALLGFPAPGRRRRS